jgi:hypothetical protein
MASALDKFKKIIIQMIPFFIGLVSGGLFWQHNLVVFLIFIGILISVFMMEYNKGEAVIFIFGIGIGLLVEVIGNYLVGYQSFANPDIFGIPLWLPLAWGYAFVFMGRMARILSK